MMSGPDTVESPNSKRVSVVDNATENRRGNDGRSGPSSVSPRSGKQVGHFVLCKTMGEGTFGEVKLAIHKPTSEKVAAKVMQKSRIKTAEDVKRVSREIKILKRVRHPNVIALYEVLDTPSTIYFMMEHCDGGELFDYIVRHQRLQEGQACFLFSQLVDGIEYLHDHYVTHRDLKPENLLLQSSPEGLRLKIIDFGLSNTHEGGRLLQTACGSPCYAAPEMIAGKSYRGPAADIWSCGVVLFTLVAGFLPFEDPNTSALYKKILSGSYETPCWLSDGAVHLLSRILHTDPVKRSTVQEIRLHAWCMAEHPLPASFRPTATAPHPAVPTRRSDLDDKLLAHALDLTKGGSNSNSDGAEPPPSLSAAAEGLLGGRHDPVGTTYHLLLKRKLRDGSAADATNPSANSAKNFGTQLKDPGQAREGSSPADGIVVFAAPRPGGDSGRVVYPKTKTNGLDGKVRNAASANAGAREVSANASNASSTTSSSRSGHRPTARRRKSDVTATAPALEGVSLKPAAAAAIREGPPISGMGADGVQSDPRDMRPQTTSAPRPTCPSTASTTSAVPMHPKAKGTGQAEVDAGTRMILTVARCANDSVRSRTQRAVPLLSFRGIARTDLNSGTVGDHGVGSGSSNGRLTNPSVFVSQTARAGRCIVDTKSNPGVPAVRRRGSQARPRGGSGSSISSGGSAGFHLTVATETPPHRPLTARAPLKSSAPTPRLSGDFCLNRPRGEAISTGCTRIVGAIASPRATREASSTTIGTPPVAEQGTSGGAGAVGSALPRPTATAQQHQPSLRVRLSRVSAQTPQQCRRPVLEAARRAGAIVRVGALAAVSESKRRGPSRLAPRQLSSCDAVAAAEAALASPTGSATEAGRELGGGHPVGWNVSSGGKARTVPSAKGWTRGASVAFRPVDPMCAPGLSLADTAPVGRR